MTDETKTDPYLSTHPEATPRLNAALAKAQGQIGGAIKDSKNPAFLRDGKPSTYADLASVITAIREAFSANAIAYPQTTVNDANGVTVTTHLRHSSGEELASPFWVPVTAKTPQGYGSATTYARRFGLMAAAGVAPEDDDGNSHSTDARVAETKTTRAGPTPKQVATLVDAFSGLGVTVAMLEDRIGYPLGNLDHSGYESLKAYGAKKRDLAVETPEAAAKRIEGEKAEAGIAAETLKARAAIDAQLAKLAADDKPLLSQAAPFAAFIDRVRSATTPEAVTLIMSEAAGSKLSKGDLAAFTRTATDRAKILADAVSERKRPKLTIEDVPF